MKKVPPTRHGLTTKFTVDHWKCYLTVNEVEGIPVEVFLRCAKHGSTIHGLLETLSIAISVGLRSGAKLEDYLEKFAFMRFEPSGYATIDFKNGQETILVHSIVDAAVRFLADRYDIELVPAKDLPPGSAPSTPDD